MKTKLSLLVSLSVFAFSFAALAGSIKVSRLSVTVDDARYEPFNVEADFYQPQNQKVLATLLLYPTISGVSPLETNTAKYFARHGFVVIVPLPFIGEIDKASPDIKKLDNEYMRPTVVALKLLELSDDKNNLSESMPVFALGASQGGIRTVGLTANSHRIKAAWFAVAGGDFPYIYANSEVSVIKKFRANEMDKLGLTSTDDFEKYLRANLSPENDPLASCSKITVPVVQLVATKDVKVPTHTQEKLESACPEHKVYKLAAGHAAGSVSILFMKHKIRKFFMENL